jgi:hypothetical protein
MRVAKIDMAIQTPTRAQVSYFYYAEEEEEEVGDREIFNGKRQSSKVSMPVTALLTV